MSAGEASPRRRAGVRVGAVLLAAGRSSRMGSGNKLLAEVHGAPMVRRAAEAVRSAGPSPVVAVTGHDAAAVEGALSGLELEVVHNPLAADGLASSLGLGVRALPTEVDGALIVLGDMPWVGAEHVRAVVAAFDPTRDLACAPTFEGRRGHPVLLSRRLFGEVEVLRGDRGARALLERYADRVRLVPVGDEGVLRDVDTPADLP